MSKNAARDVEVLNEWDAIAADELFASVWAEVRQILSTVVLTVKQQGEHLKYWCRSHAAVRAQDLPELRRVRDDLRGWAQQCKATYRPRPYLEDRLIQPGGLFGEGMVTGGQDFLRGYAEDLTAGEEDNR